MIWLLDTNTIIYAQYVGGRVRERLDEASKRGRVVTSVLVVAELFYGAAKSSRPEANRRKVEEVIRAIEVLPITIGSASRFGRLPPSLGSICTLAVGPSITQVWSPKFFQSLFCKKFLLASVAIHGPSDLPSSRIDLGFSHSLGSGSAASPA